MNEKIYDYLIMKHLNDENFKYSPNQRIKAAYILAKKEFAKLTEREKKAILKKINKKENW